VPPRSERQFDGAEFRLPNDSSTVRLSPEVARTVVAPRLGVSRSHGEIAISFVIDGVAATWLSRTVEYRIDRQALAAVN